MSWRLRPIDERELDLLCRELAVHPVTGRCLLGRRVAKPEEGRAFLEPRLSELRAPEGLAGLGAAVSRLERALRAGERIGIFGDYDADGVTTTALLTGYLQALGAPCEPRVATRDSGYGFTEADATHFVRQECTVVITGDCGTSDGPALELLAGRDIDTIVIDHHTVPAAEPGNPHPATALINPFRADSEFPFRGLASVGLAFYVMATLRSRLRSTGFFDTRPEPDVREQLDLVALGTIADLVPLEDENRILTRMGLARLAHSQRPGLRALLDHAGVPAREITETTVSFKIAPRLNAPGRLGDARPALDLLLAPTPAVGRAAAAVVEQLNSERRALQEQVTEEALAQLGDRDPGPAVVVAGTGWAPGVVGIVAARLVERYRRPAFVIAVDDDSGLGRGSCRSHGAVNLYDALASAGELLSRFGGHAAAAGLTIARDRIDAFRERMCEAVVEMTRGNDGTGDDTLADAEIDLSELDERLVRELDSLAPFGQANPEPLLVARAVKVRGVRRVGDGSHLKLELIGSQGRTLGAIGFGLGERAAELGLRSGSRVDLLFRPAISTWGGRLSLELQLRAVEPGTAADAAATSAAGGPARSSDSAIGA